MNKVERYQCDHCNKIGAKSTIQQHEKKCFNNTASKSYATCVKYSPQFVVKDVFGLTIPREQYDKLSFHKKRVARNS